MHTYIEESHCALGIHTILFASYTLVTSKVKKKNLRKFVVCYLSLIFTWLITDFQSWSGLFPHFIDSKSW